MRLGAPNTSSSSLTPAKDHRLRRLGGHPQPVAWCVIPLAAIVTSCGNFDSKFLLTYWIDSVRLGWSL